MGRGTAPDGTVARARRWPRWVGLGLVLVVLAGTVWYGLCLYQVWSAGRTDGARPADAIVVLGAAQYDGRPSPVLEARLEHALDLWRQGYAPLVFTTGGRQPGDRTFEASVSAAWLIERGVPADAVLREVNGRTSYASLAEVAAELRRRGLDRVVLVSDPFHSLRIVETAEELGLDATASATRTSPIGGMTAFRRTAREAAGVAVARLPFVGYRRLLRITE